MARLTLTDAEDKASRGRPWSFRLEYTGSNPANASGWSDKYWYATGRGLNEPVEIGWGANGQPPQGTTLSDWPKLRNVVPVKIAKGYAYVDHEYVRMSAENIAKLGGATPPSPAPVTQPVPLSQHPLGNPVQATQTLPAPVQATTKPGKVSTALLALGEPWSLVRKLKVIRDGTTVKGYSALDENGDELLKFDATGGVDFAREYDVDFDWV